MNPSQELQKELFIPVDNFELSVRSANCLRHANIKYIGELAQLTEQELLFIKNFGRKCLYEIKAMLWSMGLRVGMKFNDFPDRKDIEKIVKGEYDIWVNRGYTEHTEKYESTIGLNKTVLQKELFMPVDNLEFSVRSANCLIRADIKYVGELVQWTERELLSRKNFGRKSLREINEVLTSMDLEFGMKFDGFPNRKKLEQINSESKLADPLPLFSEEQNREISRTPNDKKITTFEAQSLEEELKSFIKTAIGGKNKKESNVFQRNCHMLISLLGFDGTGIKTLEEVGKMFNLTRERVRQIQSKGLSKIGRFQKSHRVELPFLDCALSHVLSSIPVKKETAESSLATAGISEKGFLLGGLMKAALITSKKLGFEIIEQEKVYYAIPLGARKAPKIITHFAKRAIEHYGVVTTDDIAAMASDKMGQEIAPGFVTSILSTKKGFAWLGNQNDWFWFPSIPRNQLIYFMRKILSVSGPIDVSVLRAGIGRNHRMQGFMPPRDVLLDLCRQLFWCRVDGRTIEANLNWEEELKGTTEWALCAVLKEHGTVMRKDDLEQVCLGLGMKYTTFTAYLTFSPIIHRYAMGVYGLRGAKVPPGLVESLVSDTYRTKRKTLLDSGWAKDGRIWVVHRVSEGMLRNGVFSIPASMKKYLGGTYALKTIDWVNIGNLTIKESIGWGLGPFYRRRGAEENDYLMILFDIKLMTAQIAVGEDEDMLGVFEKQEMAL